MPRSLPHNLSFNSHLFIDIKPDGKRIGNKSTLSQNFHNWFYAGWVVSEKAEIAPKTVRGNWEPVVTTEEFEQELEILAFRSRHRIANRKHDYLLKGLIYLQQPYNTNVVKLTGATSNTHRVGGGTAYYCVPRSNINIQCQIIDQQIADEMTRIQVDPDLMPLIRDSYTREIAQQLGHVGPSEQQELKNVLQSIDEEETRMARLFAIGKISEAVWDKLWEE